MKPTCTYKEAVHIKKGECALVSGVKNHESPFVSNREGVVVRTSIIQEVRLNGAFETLNTNYIKEDVA